MKVILLNLHITDGEMLQNSRIASCMSLYQANVERKQNATAYPSVQCNRYEYLFGCSHADVTTGSRPMDCRWVMDLGSRYLWTY
jgi:hypothetical protein